MNLPNKLTLSRAVMVPFFAAFLLLTPQYSWFKWKIAVQYQHFHTKHNHLKRGLPLSPHAGGNYLALLHRDSLRQYCEYQCSLSCRKMCGVGISLLLSDRCGR